VIRTLLTSLVVANVLSVAYVKADVAPPDDYEERCTLERTCPKGKECVLCPASRRDLDACSKQLEEHGFVMKCQSWGASVWDEIWCRDASDEEDASALSVPDSGDPWKVQRCKGTSEATDSDCSCRAPGARGKSDPSHYLLTGMAAAILLLFTFSRRRR
jgi:MYXO-CTERM domain-containing protein